MALSIRKIGKQWFAAGRYFKTKKAAMKHTKGLEEHYLTNPSGIMKKLRKGITGRIQLKKGRLIIKT